MQVILLTIAIACTGALGAPPQDSVVRLEIHRADRVDISTGAILVDGSILAITPSAGEGMIDDVQAITADGRQHRVTGVWSYHWTAQICLLAADWDGDPRPGIELSQADHLDGGKVTVLVANQAPVSARVLDADQISTGVRIQPDAFLAPNDCMGAVVTDEDDALLAISTSFDVGTTIAYGEWPNVFQSLGCVPAAWVQPLIDSKHSQPISWEAWCTTARDERAKIMERIAEARSTEAFRGPDAARRYRALVEDAPWHSDAWLLLAAARSAAGHVETSLLAAKQAALIDPGSHDAAIAITAAAVQEDDFELAQSTMRRAVRMRHGGLSDYYRDALYQLRAHLPEEALISVNRVLEVEPDHANAKKLKALIEELLEQRGDSDD